MESAAPLNGEEVEEVELRLSGSAIPSRPAAGPSIVSSRQTRQIRQNSIDKLLTKVSRDEYLLQTMTKERSVAQATLAATPTVRNKVPSLPDSIVKRIIEWVIICSARVDKGSLRRRLPSIVLVSIQFLSTRRSRLFSFAIPECTGGASCGNQTDQAEAYRLMRVSRLNKRFAWAKIWLLECGCQPLLSERAAQVEAHRRGDLVAKAPAEKDADPELRATSHREARDGDGRGLTLSPCCRIFVS